MQSYGGEVKAVWRSQDIGDVGTMRHPGRKAKDLEWNWPKREAMCAADSYLTPWGPADSIMSPYARHGAADLCFPCWVSVLLCSDHPSLLFANEDVYFMPAHVGSI